MKKLSLGLAALLAASAMAWAGEIKWYVNWGVYDRDATDLVTTESGAILDQYDVLWQLIYAGPNNVADPVDVTNSGKGYVSGDDEVLGTQELSNGNSKWWDNYLYSDDTDSNHLDPGYTYSDEKPYYVFQRIYDSQTPVAGQTYYYESEPVLLNSAEYGQKGSQSIGIGPMESGIQPNLVVGGPSEVPEPATMSLLGLGALAMVLRRKLRK